MLGAQATLAGICPQYLFLPAAKKMHNKQIRARLKS
jgi:hypothetical protein